MGTNGIGVAGFFDLSEADEFISVAGLTITDNRIHDCLRRAIATPPDELVGFMGYGGISLADVEALVIQHNTIVDNGPTHVDPVCGIYVLHAEGADISSNRIVNNGARIPDVSASALKRGQRGGIVIRFALPPSVTVKTILGTAPQQNGVPAIRIHDNIVSTPMGRALSLMALGPVSVVANQFTSQGIPPFSVDLSGFFSGAVSIFNLGISNDFFYLQQILFKSLTKANGPQYLTNAAEDALAKEGLDDQRLARLLANGQVIFNDNQVNLDLLARGLSFSASAIAIFTFDDLSFANNQCEANLLDDLLFTNLLCIGMTMRARGNRFKEGMYNAPLSAFTMGLMMNTTAENQGTHCIIARSGVPGLLYRQGNTVLMEYFMKGFCDRGFSNYLSGFADNNLSYGTPAAGGTTGLGVATSTDSNILELLK
jgi:hypothetical protein